MSSNFTVKRSENISTALTSIGGYTVAANTGAIVVGLTVSNTTNEQVFANIVINNGTSDYYIIKNAIVPAAGTLVAVGQGNKIVLQAGDTVKVNSSLDFSVDAMMSVMESSDVGVTTDPAPPVTFSGSFNTTPIGTYPSGDILGYGGGIYIAHSTSSNVYYTTTSLDSAWTTRSTPANTTTLSRSNRVIYYNSKFYIWLYNSSLGGIRLYTSPDGINWTIDPNNTNFSAANGNYVVSATNGSKIYAGKWFNETTPSTSWLSSDGATWSQVTSNFPGKRPTITGRSIVAWGSGNVLVGLGYVTGTKGNISYSTDAGNSWTTTSTTQSSRLVAYGNGTFVSLGDVNFYDDYTVYTSSNGSTWSNIGIPSIMTVANIGGNGYGSMDYGSGYFVATGASGVYSPVVSSDGVNWSLGTTMPETGLRCIYLNSQWILYRPTTNGNVYVGIGI